MKIKLFIIISVIIVALMFFVSLWYGVAYIAILFAGYTVLFFVNVLYVRKKKGKVTLFYVADREDLIKLGEIKKARGWRNYSGLIFFPGVYVFNFNPIHLNKTQLNNYGLNTKKNLYVYELTVPRDMVSIPLQALVFEQGARKINIKGKGLNLNEIQVKTPERIPFNIKK
ncbi:hypothetical protein [Priestia megaterium]|uniref:hypothetical protein n=1 Tax=Priestia megaterium TaxID=1404 RepID=UPI001F407B69|nr:hypothetical protein [Priestia megaterium]MCF8890430.1 hypothetical protein [Priestia megaterium]